MTILVVGASSRLGRATLPLLVRAGWPVRAMTREPARLTDLAAGGVEVVRGDLRDRPSVAAAVRGASRVLYAAQALMGRGGNSAEAVDGRGARTLIEEARFAQVEHLVFTSAQGADPHSPVDFMRYKAAAEQALRESGLSWTILRPAAFMEFWGALLGEPVLRGRPAVLFGRGQNPNNFVAVQDVARCAVVALGDPAARGQLVPVAGPQNLTLLEVVHLFEEVAGREARVRHVPLPLLRALSVLARPVSRPVARLAALGVQQDTGDMALDPAALPAPFPRPAIRLREIAQALAEQVTSQSLSPGSLYVSPAQRR